MMLWGEETPVCPSDIFSTLSRTWTGLGSDMVLRGVRPTELVLPVFPLFIFLLSTPPLNFLDIRLYKVCPTALSQQTIGMTSTVKVKVTLVQTLRLCTGRMANRGSRGIALPFHDHGTGSASRPGRSLPPGKTRYLLYRRLGGPQGWSGQVR
jgi:hypothetical protein